MEHRSRRRCTCCTVGAATIPPVIESSTTAEVLHVAALGRTGIRPPAPGKWTRTFFQAEETAEGIRRKELPPTRPIRCCAELLHDGLARGTASPLVERYMTLPDVLEIWKRMIGTGLIGGKSVGMLLARAILRQTGPRWHGLLEAHDSFFVGSNVFCSFLVENDCWWLRQKQRDPDNFLDNARRGPAADPRRPFPRVSGQRIRRDARLLRAVADHRPFEQPAGGQLRQRLRRKVRERVLRQPGPARTSGCRISLGRQDGLRQHDEQKALRYRAQRGLLDRDEQMSLLVQRVSGGCYGSLFFPQVAGVALLAQPLRLERADRSGGGMVRLVFGLGTRAVDRWGRRLHADRGPRRTNGGPRAISTSPRSSRSERST